MSVVIVVVTVKVSNGNWHTPLYFLAESDIIFNFLP